MTKDEVIHIAHVAGVVDFLYSNPDLQDAYEFLQRFATLVATAERQPLTDEQIMELAEPFGAFEYGDAQGHKRQAFVRAIEEAVWKQNS